MKSYLLLILLFYTTFLIAQEEEFDSIRHRWEFSLDYRMNIPLGEMSRNLPLSQGFGFNVGFAPIKDKHLFINLETGLAFYRGNVLRNIIYRDNINNTFFADRGLSHRIGELNLNVFYGFIISNKKSFPLLLLGPTLKLGLYDFNTVYTIEQSQQSLNNNWDDDDDFSTEYYRKTLIVSAGWHVTPGVKLRFYPLRHFIFLDFQASYSFGSNFRFMNYNQAGSPDQGFIAVRTSNHPNAFTEWVGNVFEANINLLQLKLGFGINIFSFRKKGNVTLD